MKLTTPTESRILKERLKNRLDILRQARNIFRKYKELYNRHPTPERLEAKEHFRNLVKAYTKDINNILEQLKS